MAFNHLLVRFHCQQECRNTNGKHGHHGNLRWFQRIGDHKRHRKQRQQKAENIFYQKQACRSFDIINDPTSFQYNRRHTRKIRFQQYQLRSLCCCVTSRGHRNTAVSVFQCKYIVDTITGHCNGFPCFFQCTDKLSLLIRCHTAENRIF